MSSISNAIRMIVNNNSTIYCGLCMLTIEQGCESFYVHDEVFILDKVVPFYEILSILFGNQIPDYLSTIRICQNCTKTAINSYRFISICKKNIQNINTIIDCIQKSTAEVTVAQENYKSLYLDLNANNYTVSCFYDVKQANHNEEPLERFKYLKGKENFISIDFEYDPDYSNDIDLNKSKNDEKNGVRKIDLRDLPYEKDDNDYKCKICSKIYPSILSIRDHYFRVHASKDFKCTQCPKRFGSTSFLNRHIRNSHLFTVCSQCGKTINNSTLWNHAKTHQTHLVCKTCGKVFKTKSAFDKHVKQNCVITRKSNLEAEFKCIHCDKKYSHKSALRVHIRVEHEGGKAVSCEWCGKKFGSISTLEEHKLKHTKEKNFRCDFCGCKFVSKASLTYHMRTHTGEKPYKCHSCDLGFISASARSSHVHRHHSAELECDVCHGKFKGLYCLNRHRKIHLKDSRKVTN